MGNLIIYFIIVIIFFIIGQVIASYDKEFIKHNLQTTNRMINNYYGNLISSIGFFIIFADIFGINNIICFSSYALTILIFYILHVKQASGESVDIIVREMIENNPTKKYMFRRKTYIIILSLLISSFISTKFIAPVLIKEKVEKKEEIIITETTETIEKDKQKEIEEQEYMNEIFLPDN